MATVDQLTEAIEDAIATEIARPPLRNAGRTLAKPTTCAWCNRPAGNAGICRTCADAEQGNP
jgi:hypothetical protein